MDLMPSHIRTAYSMQVRLVSLKFPQPYITASAVNIMFLSFAKFQSRIIYPYRRICSPTIKRSCICSSSNSSINNGSVKVCQPPRNPSTTAITHRAICPSHRRQAPAWTRTTTLCRLMANMTRTGPAMMRVHSCLRRRQPNWAGHRCNDVWAA